MSVVKCDHGDSVVMGDAVARTSLYGFEIREPDERRVPAQDRKTYDIKQMWQRHHEIVNLAARGFKQVEIAEILCIHPQTVSNALNSQLGEEKLSEIRMERDIETKKIVEKVRVLTNKAIEVYYEIFDDESGQVSLRDKKEVADKVLLELSGLRAPTKVQTVSTVLTLDEIESFKRRGLEAAKEAGLVIDVEPEAANG